MIRVNRGPEPEGFAEGALDWQRRFAEAQARNPDISPGKFWSQVRREIRIFAQILYNVFYGKCAFCEAKMSHVTNPHVEHYRPKRRDGFPELMFVWENWLLSCGRCNEKKWSHFPYCDAEPCLLDPTTDIPDDHLDFLDAQIVYKTPRGKETIRLVGLDRPPLEEERAQWLNVIRTLLLLVLNVPKVSREAREVRELLIWAMQPDAPYTAMTRAFLSKKAPRLAYPSTPHPYIKPHKPMERITVLIEQYNSALQDLE